MKILLVHNYYQNPGGEDIVFKQELTALSKNHQTKTLIFKNKKGIIGILQYLFYPYNIFAAWKLRKAIKAFNPDIVHIHNIHYASGPILFRAAHRLRVPTVLTVHNYRLVCPSALLLYKGKEYFNSVGKSFPWKSIKLGVLDGSVLKTFITAFTFRLHVLLGTWKNIDAYITLTNYAKNLLLQGKLGLKTQQIYVKPNFIEPVQIDQTIRKDYYLYVGRLSEEKGIKELLAVFDEPNAPKLKIVGSGPLKNSIQHANIEYLGFLTKEKIALLLNECKALIIPSICKEAFPLTLLEGFSQKTPIIASRLLAASEIITDGINGFLIDPFDFKLKLKEIDSRTDLDKIGEEGYNTYLKKYVKETIMQDLESIYKSII